MEWENRKEYLNHIEKMKNDLQYRNNQIKLREKAIIDYWNSLTPFKKSEDIPKLPNDLNDFFINKLIELGAIPKEKLEEGIWYYGGHRIATISMWNGKKFLYWRHKFGNIFVDTCEHFQNDDGYSLFVPIRKATIKEIMSKNNNDGEDPR